MAKIIPFSSIVQETPAQRIVRLMRLKLAAMNFENPHLLDPDRVAALLA